MLRSLATMVTAFVLLCPRVLEAQKIVDDGVGKRITLTVVLDTLQRPATVATFRWIGNGEAELDINPEAGQAGLNQALRRLGQAFRKGLKASSPDLVLPVGGGKGRVSESDLWKALLKRPYSDWHGRPARVVRTHFVVVSQGS